MWHRTAFCWLVSAAWAALTAAAATAAPPAGKADLRILYAGDAGSPRAKDFTRFLREHFAAVTEVALGDLWEGDANGHDVVVIDWSSTYRRGPDGKLVGAADGGPFAASPPVPRLPADFDRPTVLVGAAGGQVAREQRLKIDWLCLCLWDAAHGVAEGHDVFRTPHRVEVAYDEVPTPAAYRDWPGGDRLGKTLKVWRVQTRTFPDVDPGLVSDPFGFADSPDAEVVAGGLNGKGPGAVALARHGNYFQWGFSAQPSDMTAEARKCFVNVVHYVRRFDRQKPLVRKTARGREWALVVARRLREARDERLLAKLPADLRARFGTDYARYAAYYEENLEYLRPDGGLVAVDEDAKALGLSNRRAELLDRCVGLLEAGERTELAGRVLRRYTGEAFADAAGWRRWLDANRPRLFFTDVGGYRFVVGPEPPATPGRR